jgi:hypothetical protein
MLIGSAFADNRPKKILPKRFVRIAPARQHHSVSNTILQGALQ